MQKVISVGEKNKALSLCGPNDRYLKELRRAFNVKVVARGGEVSLEGPPNRVRGVEKVLSRLSDRLERRKPIADAVVERLIEEVKLEQTEGGKKRREAKIEGFERGRPTVPKTEGQAQYVEAIRSNDIVFCTGPAGSGKTYLAVAVALEYLQKNRVDKIILCRPAVEAGERLGFLPGDMYSKVNPYLRPLYDALSDLMATSTVSKYIENDLIEVLPLAFIRGRTLDDAFIIFDEAQNCTVDQMKTFLTRLGVSAKLVVTGDITQIDLPSQKRSGLVDVQERLRGIPSVGHIRLKKVDIVRHRLVRRIVEAYRQEPGATPRQESQEENRDDQNQQ